MGQEWCQKYYQDKIRKPLTKFFVKFNISANQITVFSHLLSLTFGVYFFSRGTFLGNILGIGVMIIIGILDYADGDIARQNKTIGPLGVWIDSVFDVVIQNAIMGAIAIGCYKNGLPVGLIVFYFVGNAALNLVSFHYNQTFKFDSHNGSELFRKYMEEKPNLFNRFMKNLIDPTASGVGLWLYTCRYWLVLGSVAGNMSGIFAVIVVITNFRWIVMYALYAAHLQEYKKLWVSQALAIIDEERDEYHALQRDKKV